MKIRSDFITNSSSSAFVVIGARLVGDGDYEELYEKAEENGLRFFGEENVIGKVIARLDYDDYDSLSISLGYMKDIFELVGMTLKNLGIKEEVYLITDMFST